MMMKREIIFTLPLMGALILLLLNGPSLSFAADGAGQSLKASSLSSTEQTEVHARAASAISAGVPAEDVEVIVARAADRGMDAGTIIRFLDLGALTKKDGLPVGPVLDRIEQGLSKGIPAERIQSASERLAQKLAEARPVVDVLMRGGMPSGGNDRDTAIASAARALEQRMTLRDIESVGAAVQGKKGPLALFAKAVDAAGYFAEFGMAPVTASHLVADAVQRGYSARDLDSLIKQVDREMRRGIKAEDIAAKMEREGMQIEREMEREMKGNHGPGGSPGMGGPRR